MRRSLMTAVMLIAAMIAIPLPARASDQQNLVDEARITLDHMRRDREFGNALDLMHRAKGVLIVPNLIKGGLFLGGEGGEGVLLTRRGDGWSNPVFYTIASASFGLQIGLESAEFVLIVLTDRGLKAFMSDEFKIGVQGGLAVVTLGSTVEGSTSSALGADIVVWSSATGLYGGLTINGSLIKPRDSWNSAYYGHADLPSVIIDSPVANSPGADNLRAAISRLQ